MVIFVLILFICLLHYSIGYIIEVFKLKPVAYVSTLTTIGFILFFTVGLHYTSDYNMYYYIYKYNIETSDFMFWFLSRIFKSFHLSFQDLYIFHIVISTLMFYWFIRRNTLNVFFIFFMYICLDYVHFSNQIRYYMGFPFLLLCFDFLFKKKYIVSILFAVLAFLCHAALLLLLLFVPLYYFLKNEKYDYWIFILSGLFFALIGGLMISPWGQEIKHFGYYFGDDEVSSFSGGLLISLPYILFMSLIVFETMKYRKRKANFNSDIQYLNLYKLSYFSFIFVPSSIVIQILGYRYVMPFFVVYALYYLYMIKDLDYKIKGQKMLLFTLVCLVALFIIYVLPDILLGSNSKLKEIEQMLQSIRYINFNEW